MNQFKDVAWLKAHHEMVHYFGLGFIQLKIDQTYRMHFYTPELPPIVPEEDIHNHRYDFSSTIIKGEFHQELFHVLPELYSSSATHLREQETCKEGSKADAPPAPCSIALASRHTYAAGSKYFISHQTFHRVRATDCITLLERGPYMKELAEVIRAVDAGKVCPFSQKVEEDRLWEIIQKML